MQWILQKLPSGVKHFGYEVDHSVPSSSEFNYSVELYLISSICLQGMVLI
jgi:hypothetical protein